MKIIKDGIDLGKGKAGGDFSDGDGFYTTSNFAFAKDWSKKLMRKPNTAVIIFKKPSNLFSNYEGEEFPTADKNWESAVRYFRNGKDASECGRKAGNKFKRLDCVFGPISKDGSVAKQPNWTPRPRDPLKFELCLRNSLLADEFHNQGENIERVIFFHSK